MVQGRRGSFARVNVPELGGVVVAAREYVLVVWGKGHRPNPIVVQQRFADQPPGRHLPDARRIIRAPSDDVAPIRAERGTEVLPNPVRNGPAPVANDPGSGATRDERWVKVAQGQGGIALRQRSSRARVEGQVPDAGEFVFRAGDQATAVGTEVHRDHIVLMDERRANLFAGQPVPKAGEAVFAAGRHQAAIGVEADGLQQSWMTHGRTHQPAVRNRIDEGLVAVAGHGQVQTIPAQGQRHHLRRLDRLSQEFPG